MTTASKAAATDAPGAVVAARGAADDPQRAAPAAAKRGTREP
eukprot:CAMPEP_0185556110 /NCGR_PEP_ID=MMETSP1381-20130426/46269_1 /TAXON_ID=298111 /ORGANISM="Pavlova sp., Strain CCMP459" /LENGTH=41 /DNA_ID= /DNA_START= /DNA_END= /DNA_ORIENTATION=